MTIGLCDKEGRRGIWGWIRSKCCRRPSVNQEIMLLADCQHHHQHHQHQHCHHNHQHQLKIFPWVSKTFWVRYLEAKIRGTSRGTLDQDQGTLRGGARGRWPYSGNVHFGPAAEGHVGPGIVKIFDHLDHPDHPAHHCHDNFSNFCIFHSGIAYLSDYTVKLRLFRICLNAAPLKLSSTVGPH